MKNFKASSTKTNYYILFNGELFQFSKNFTPKVVAQEFPHNMGNFEGHADNIAQAIAMFKVYLKQSLAEKKIRNAEISARFELEKKERIKKFEQKIKNGSIEATIENIRSLAEWINQGKSYNFPKLNMGYSTHNYNCGGKIATTITLDNPISHNGKLETKFVYGAPIGHLTKYNSL